MAPQAVPGPQSCLKSAAAAARHFGKVNSRRIGSSRALGWSSWRRSVRWVGSPITSTRAFFPLVLCR